MVGVRATSCGYDRVEIGLHLENYKHKKPKPLIREPRLASAQSVMLPEQWTQ
jgi:hypothetical protein